MNEVFVIAEIGINHNGSLSIARQLIELALAAGCDAVKFQKRDVATVYAGHLDDARESPWGKTLGLQKRGLELSRLQYDEIDHYCRRLGMPWFASAWDFASLEFLDAYDLPYNKIASAMLTNLEFCIAVASRCKKTFISTGMATIEDIERVVDIFLKWDAPITLMHTVSTYPCPEDQLNIAMIGKLRAHFGCPVGYSGHETSVSPSVIAAALGATVIERHITLDRAMYGSDQAASLEPEGLHTLVAQLRKLPVVIGDGVKRITPDEALVAKKLRYWE